MRRRIKAIWDRFRNKARTGKAKKTVPENARVGKKISEKKDPSCVRPTKPKASDLGRKKDKSGKSAQLKKDSHARGDRPGTEAGWKLSDFMVPTVEGETRFHDLGLPDPVMHAIADLGFKYCTPIQAGILPSTLERKDATGRAQTGTGKTAAFLITALSWMLRNPIKGKRRHGSPRVLIIAPTRELVLQIEDEARKLSNYCPFTLMSVFGGMDYERQQRKLTGKIIDIIVATPGRLLDYHRKHDVHLGKVEILVIDEADRMLDMGFIPDVRRIIQSTPPKSRRQTLLFSATLTLEVTRLASQWTREPVVIEIEPEHVAVDTVNQVVYTVTTKKKYALLYNVITKQNLERVLVFCNRRDETRRLAETLRQYRINCALLSGEVPQKKRIQTLENFKSGKIRVLVATDVAGRGIHVEAISHVINYTLPHDPEDYVHRIGRTGRAGASGTSVSFACEEDSFYIPDIEEFIGQKLTCITPDEDWLKLPPKAKPRPQKRRGWQPSAGRQPQRTRQPQGKKHGNARRNKARERQPKQGRE
ncbi:MAG: ATP-dependent RNA helicase RhlB [Desulfobacteraceae bacterium]|nr:MAG: ATP-dependent RNA helicase RhlB [Desulfobacteraceae bacterium]